MNSEQITAFLQEHWYIASVLIGAVILFNWSDGFRAEEFCRLGLTGSSGD